MKLTSTLLATAVAAGLCSTAANADTLVYDTFDADQGWVSWYDYWASGAPLAEAAALAPSNGMAIIDFRKGAYTANDPTLTQPWVVSAPDGGTTFSDTSIITNATGNWAVTVPGTNSVPGAAQNDFFLALDTQGDTLSRTFAETTFADETAAPLFVDTMIQFTASDGEPTDLANQGAHIALWLDKDSTNLMMFAKTSFDEFASWPSNSYVIASEISATNWYRLTVQSKYIGGELFFRVALNGTWLATADAHTEKALKLEEEVENEEATKKYWFMSAQGPFNGNSATLSEVAFQGTGAVDNLTVTTDAPDFEATPSGVVLTLSWDSTIASVTKDGNALNSGDMIDSGDTITISAATWYALNDQGTNITGDVTISDISGAGATFGANDYTNLTVTLSASAAATATIKAAPYGAGTITAGMNSGIDASKAAAWAIAEGITTVDGFAAKYQQYLLNADADATVTFAIESIETTAAGATITVKATADGTTITGTYNGVVKYQAADTIAGLAGATKTEASGITFENGIGTFTVPVADGKFVRAWVE